MTLLSELHELAERWHRLSEGFHSPYSETCADELTELLGKVVVTDEMVKRALNVRVGTFPVKTSINPATVRAIIESALGVTK
jgi:hypothetical protein